MKVEDTLYIGEDNYSTLIGWVVFSSDEIGWVKVNIASIEKSLKALKINRNIEKRDGDKQEN
jgi:hypothetical protein